MPDPTHSAPAPFAVRYINAARRDELARDPHTLALIGFADAPWLSADDTCNFDLVLPQLAGTPLCEHWSSPTPVERIARDGLRIARNDDILFASLQLPADDIRSSAHAIYDRILELLDDSAYPHLLRVWNYFPRILDVEDGLERYQSFCVGRYHALEMLGEFEAALPAASALGSHGGPLNVYLLAAREPGIQIENPRQISAFRYPPRYSPRSPSFARALLKRWPERDHLYISGTASIVGHESRHATLLPQLEEILTNIDALIGEAHTRHGLSIRSIAELDLLKVYLREPALLEPVRDALETRLPAGAAARIYLHATVCRSDLLMEIEGLSQGTGRTLKESAAAVK
ncbi:hypothetical protein [Acidihalobacter ferrooxydans]|uniref:Chorismatase FkbO/Hyg5-like N-terminal domain-containing protein n=1 Tax=Acidihalobacter ferrooxydans TaxID=1765967 RepID=A0A1P8UE11_9GAMM|nr:hypothetical protein [Acidihalobacter ferrooxydans]APZ42063.1 hypothetical protein BW247_02255 [Acidihalobacter ferrooxydans]